MSNPRGLNDSCVLELLAENLLQFEAVYWKGEVGYVINFPFESVLFGLHGWSSFAVKLIVNIRLPVCFAKLTTRNSHVIYKR